MLARVSTAVIALRMLEVFGPVLALEMESGRSFPSDLRFVSTDRLRDTCLRSTGGGDEGGGEGMGGDLSEGSVRNDFERLNAAITLKALGGWTTPPTGPGEGE